MFVNRWCILTPPEDTPPAAVELVRRFWTGLGAHLETMTPTHHDHVLAITSHIPHLIAFSIFHTALRFEEDTRSEVMKFSAGGFRDFTRIAASNPTMWRDIFLTNKEAVLAILRQFNLDLAAIADAIEKEDGEKLLQAFSKSRITRRKVIEKEHISVTANRDQRVTPLIRPYGSDD
jgi:cyclohexadieny/prephenate dehydrogenase